jgi:hypothetical protein
MPPKENGDNAKVPLICPTRVSLLQKWRAAAELESTVVARAERSRGCASLNEQADLAANVAEIRRQAVEALAALQAHRESHGC